MPAEEDTGAAAVSRELPIRNIEPDTESFEYVFSFTCCINLLGTEMLI